MSSTSQFLLIDDDEMINFIHQRVIQSVYPDAVIEQAVSPTEALRLLQAKSDTSDHSPLVVLMDINMPEMNGFELLEEINNQWPAIVQQARFYMVSSSLFERDRQKALSFSFVKGYLEKPLSKESIEAL
jgi:CheY-like chemotaxis protein